MPNKNACIAFASGCAALLIMTGSTRAQSPDGTTLPIALTCSGSGTATDSETTFTNTYDRKTKSYEHGTEMANVKRPYNGSSSVEISVGAARIKLPSAMIPPLETSNREGWFPIQDFSMNEREIKGTIRINILNKPKLLINRMTGTITLSGAYSDFTGQCERIAADAKPKF